MFVLAVALGIVFAAITFSAPVSALSGSDFNATRIIDDALFFSPNTMNSGDIQAFLSAKVPACDTNGTQPSGRTGYPTRADWGRANGYAPPYTCLKDYSQSIQGSSADSYCGGSVSAGTKSAAQIIYDVSQACGVSSKVMIVLLQKEQSLVTDEWPWSIQYRSATGYGCPDTAPCDAEYYGFFNQVYNAARQFQRYVKQSGLFNYTGGKTNFVQYNPNAGCGGSNVAIQNQATAGLYNYTPYQPNQAALNNLYGTGDSCSAYGNRNFWRMYIDWFGSPLSTVAYAWMYEGQWAYSDAARTQQFTSVPTVAPGEKIYMRIKARNMGTQTWDSSFLRLGTSRSMDRVSQFAEAGWLSSVRPAQLTEASIAPGQIGTFDFAILGPSSAGTYNEYFNILAENRAWLNDLGLYYTVNVNSVANPSNTLNTSLNSGASLNRDDYLLSPDSQSVLAVQRDGNLVLYSNFQAVWNTGALGGSTNRLVMQTDGNLVFYDQNNRTLWSSQTNNNPGARLVLQTDGNLVIYSTSNAVLWATYTTHNPNHLNYINTTFKTGALYPRQSIDTTDRRFRLVLQPDGNLVLYSPNRALWATGTDGKSAAYLAMQTDGNLVLYDHNNQPLWYTNTSAVGKSYLAMQTDGNLVLYNLLNQHTWLSHTAGSL